MIKRIKKSLKLKAFIVLFILGVPLLILGIITNIVTTKVIENKLILMANQTLDTLSLYISNKFQTQLDLTYYFSNNNDLYYRKQH